MKHSESQATSLAIKFANFSNLNYSVHEICKVFLGGCFLAAPCRALSTHSLTLGAATGQKYGLTDR